MNKINKQNGIIIAAIIFSALVIFFAFNYTKKDSLVNNNEEGVVVEENMNNVFLVDGKQTIEIKAKGGYSPVHSVAKAGIPTILRLNTNGTFDCSSSIRIPSLNISKNLPMSGTTDIDLGNPKEGILRGTCGMGMYPFEINFQN